MWSALQYGLGEFVVFDGVFLPPWKVASLFGKFSHVILQGYPYSDIQ